MAILLCAPAERSLKAYRSGGASGVLSQSQTAAALGSVDYAGVRSEVRSCSKLDESENKRALNRVLLVPISSISEFNLPVFGFGRFVLKHPNRFAAHQQMANPKEFC